MHFNRSCFGASAMNQHARITQITQATNYVRISCLGELPQYNPLAHIETVSKSSLIPVGVVGSCARAYASAIYTVISVPMPLPLLTGIALNKRTVQARLHHHPIALTKKGVYTLVAPAQDGLGQLQTRPRISCHQPRLYKPEAAR